MKHPVLIVGSIVFCLIIICAAFIGLIALNGSRLEESSKSFAEE
jgi:hypothetical protein